MQAYLSSTKFTKFKVKNLVTDEVLDVLSGPFRIFKDFEVNYSEAADSYETEGAVYQSDTNVMNKTSFELEGKIISGYEDQVLRFFNTSKIFRIDINYNGSDYYFTAYRGNQSHMLNHSRNTTLYSFNGIMRTYFLKETDWRVLSEDLIPKESGKYDTPGNTYDTATYGGTKGNDLGIDSFYYEGHTNGYIEVQGLGNLTTAEIYINGKTISYTELIPRDKEFSYSNLPLNTFLKVGPDNAVGGLDSAKPHFNLYLKPGDNYIVISGLKAIKIRYTGGYRLI